MMTFLIQQATSKAVFDVLTGLHPEPYIVEAPVALVEWWRLGTFPPGLMVFPVGAGGFLPPSVRAAVTPKFRLHYDGGQLSKIEAVDSSAVDPAEVFIYESGIAYGVETGRFCRMFFRGTECVILGPFTVAPEEGDIAYESHDKYLRGED